MFLIPMHFRRLTLLSPFPTSLRCLIASRLQRESRSLLFQMPPEVNTRKKMTPTISQIKNLIDKII